MVYPPPMRIPRPAAGEIELAGKRVILVVVDESGQVHYEHDWRAASEQQLDAAGDGHIWVLPEAAWYAWTGQQPRTDPMSCPDAQRWPVSLVWAE